MVSNLLSHSVTRYVLPRAFVVLGLDFAQNDIQCPSLHLDGRKRLMCCITIILRMFSLAERSQSLFERPRLSTRYPDE